MTHEFLSKLKENGFLRPLTKDIKFEGVITKKNAVRHRRGRYIFSAVLKSFEEEDPLPHSLEIFFEPDDSALYIHNTFNSMSPAKDIKKYLEENGGTIIEDRELLKPGKLENIIASIIDAIKNSQSWHLDKSFNPWYKIPGKGRITFKFINQ